MGNPLTQGSAMQIIFPCEKKILKASPTAQHYDTRNSGSTPNTKANTQPTLLRNSRLYFIVFNILHKVPLQPYCIVTAFRLYWDATHQ